MQWLAPLLALTAMEVVLGVDNVVFLTVTTARLPKEKRPFARKLGLALALALRIGLLFTIGFLLQLEKPLFHLSSLGLPASWVARAPVDDVSAKDLILFFGGMFLLAKSVLEIHQSVEGGEEPGHELGARPPKKESVLSAILMIGVLDLVFSLDSILSAVAMAKDLWVMIVATSIAVAVMALFAAPVGRYVHRHPTVKMLALSYLVLIGVLLITDALGAPIPKGYVYFAMAFSFGVELLNGRARRRKRGSRPDAVDAHASASDASPTAASPTAAAALPRPEPAFRGYGFQPSESDVVARPR